MCLGIETIQDEERDSGVSNGPPDPTPAISDSHSNITVMSHQESPRYPGESYGGKKCIRSYHTLKAGSLGERFAS